MKEGFDYNQEEILNTDKKEFEITKDKVNDLYEALNDGSISQEEVLDIIADTYSIDKEEVKSYLNLPLNEGKEESEEKTDCFYFQAKNNIVEVKGFEHPIAQEIAVKILASVQAGLEEILDKEEIKDNFVISFELKSQRLDSSKEDLTEEGNKKKQRETKFGIKNFNPALLTFEFEGIDWADYPDFSDAYVASAEYDGKPLSDEQVEEINNEPYLYYDDLFEEAINSRH